MGKSVGLEREHQFMEIVFRLLKTEQLKRTVDNYIKKQKQKQKKQANWHQEPCHGKTHSGVLCKHTVPASFAFA